MAGIRSDLSLFGLARSRSGITVPDLGSESVAGSYLAF
jgi:hypothetical protein